MYQNGLANQDMALGISDFKKGDSKRRGGFWFWWKNLKSEAITYTI
jgi:hypothetical protein